MNRTQIVETLNEVADGGKQIIVSGEYVISRAGGNTFYFGTRANKVDGPAISRTAIAGFIAAAVDMGQSIELETA